MLFVVSIRVCGTTVVSRVAAR